jgi:ElaB/YqjD/DUF883 family membrane-anchored ribosome-binding protein
MASMDVMTPRGDPRNTEQAIDDERGDPAGTGNETENRQSPGRLLAKAGGATAERAQRMARNIRDRDRAEGSSRSAIEIVKDNPIPAAMVGIGLAWLFMNRTGSGKTSVSHVRSGESASARESSNGEGADTDGTIERATEYGREKVEQIKHGTEEAVERIRETSERIGRQARQQAVTAEHRFENMMRENPLVVGAAALGVGFAIALAVPGTEAEDELFGRVRERVVEGTRNKALGAIQKGQQTLNAAAELVTGGSESTH